MSIASRVALAHSSRGPTALGGPIGPLTIGEQVGRIAPGWGWEQLGRWPPDAFAATSTILADSGLYRHVVCPPPGESWPPPGTGAEDWDVAVRRCGVEWAARAAEEVDEPPALPDAVARLVDILDGVAHLSIADLDLERNWSLVSTILTLHALADEACVGVGFQADTEFQRLAAARLADTGTLSHLPPDRLLVLPKLRPPEAGITLRSLSHHLAINRSEVNARWFSPPGLPAVEGPARTARFTMLLVPFPTTVHASDFQPVRGPLLNMDESRYGFYEYAPQEAFDPNEILGLVASAQRQVGAIDALVLPEAAIEEPVAIDLAQRLADAQVPMLITGVRRPSTSEGSMGANYAFVGGATWQAPPQHKHHRWCLDPEQVHQYHLGGALDPSHRWWEAIRVEKRGLTFVTVSDRLTVCALVCEDLARPDPVTDVIRAVAPTLVVGLLLDGPQLVSRWSARYASVLADDPGCSVLTLTALGMAKRSQPPGCDPSRVVALWKDPRRGLQQIALAEGARAVALTAHRRQVKVLSADGRWSVTALPELVLSGLEQIS